MDLDDEVSSDHSGSNRSPNSRWNRDDGTTGMEPVVTTPTTHNDEEDIISVGASKKDLMVAWSRIAQQLEDEIAQGIVPLSAEIAEVTAVVEDDERTHGSDNSKCSFGYEKPIIKNGTSHRHKKSSKSKRTPPKDEQDEVLKSLFPSDPPVLDKTPSKLFEPWSFLPATTSDEPYDNTTCTWSESADSSIPTVIYIRRDLPPIIPDDEALGQNYTPEQLRAIHDYTSRMNQGSSSTSTTTPKSYLMKGLRFLTLGAIGSTSSSNNKGESMTTPVSMKLKKIHLDDDASEAFHQTLIDI